MAGMSSTLLSRNQKLLEILLGNSIVRVVRQIFKDDKDREDYEQSADGPVEFTFSDGTVVHLKAETERFGVGVVEGAMPAYGDSYETVEVSRNTFWQPRLFSPVSRIEILVPEVEVSDEPSECGLILTLETGPPVAIEYLDEEEYPDMIRVADATKGCSGMKVGMELGAPVPQ